MAQNLSYKGFNRGISVLSVMRTDCWKLMPSYKQSFPEDINFLSLFPCDFEKSVCALNFVSVNDFVPLFCLVGFIFITSLAFLVNFMKDNLGWQLSVTPPNTFLYYHTLVLLILYLNMLRIRFPSWLACRNELMDFQQIGHLPAQRRMWHKSSPKFLNSYK